MVLFRSLLLTCLSVFVLAAQYTTGRVEGSILDASGATLENASVSLTSEGTSAKREFRTGTDGIFLFAAVPPGRYVLEATAAGFASASLSLAVSTSQTATHTFTLQPGQQTTAIVVQEQAAPLQEAEPQRGATRSALELATLPNLGRSVINVVSLAPGVQPTFNPRGGNLVTLSIAQAGQIAANGGRAKATSHQLDYTDANDWEFGGFALGTQPTPDMLQEFQVLTSNWGAEYGVKASAQVLMITKSGTNDLHGSAYNFLQNSALNARDYFDRTGQATPLRQNFYGVTAGLPLLRNRTFVFAGYEGRETRGAGSTVVATLPTQAARDRVTDASVRSILQLLPLPASSTANPDLGTSAVLSSSPSSADLLLLRGDHRFNDSNTLTLRYFQNVGSNLSRTAGSLPEFDAAFDPVGRNAMAAHTWVANTQTVNELRLAYGRSSALFTPLTEPATPRFNVAGLVGFGTVQSWPQGRIFNLYQVNDVLTRTQGRHLLKFGFDLRRIQDNSINDSNRRGVFVFPTPAALLSGTPTSWTQVFGNTYRGFRTQVHAVFVQDDWKIAPTLTLNLGLRWEYQGGLEEANQLQSVLDPETPGSIGQAGTGVLGSFRNQSPVVEGNSALFAPRIGFAWNPGNGPAVLRGGYGIFYDSFLFNGLQAGRTTPPTNYAAALGAGQFTGTNSLANLLAGTAAIQQQFAAQVGGFGTLANLGSITTTLPRLRNPYMQHFSLGVQRRFGGAWVADLAYVGTKGTALTTYGPANSVARGPAPAVSLQDEAARLTDFAAAVTRQNGVGNTRLDPRFNDVNLLRDNGSSIYHSLQTEIRKNFSYGLLLRGSYTWSKSIDNSSDYSPGQATTDRNFAQDQFNLANERGVSTFDVPHRFVLAHVWQIPVFRSQNGVVGRVLGGWTFASINQVQSGIPYTVLSGARLGVSDVNQDGNLVSGLDNARASCVAGGAGFTFGNPATVPAAVQRGVNGAPNSSNFRYIQPLLGNNGTCGRNTERMQRLVNFDWTFSKDIRLFEQGPIGSGPYGLEFRADLFNIFNVPFLTAVGDDFRNLASPGFGLFNAAARSRRIQLALRLTW